MDGPGGPVVPIKEPDGPRSDAQKGTPMKTMFSSTLRRLLVVAGLVAAAGAQAGLLGGGSLAGGGSLTGFGQPGRMNNNEAPAQRPMLVDRSKEAVQKGADAARGGVSRVEDRTARPRSVEAGAAAGGSVSASRNPETRSVEAGAQAGASAGAQAGPAPQP
jgi:hypothetical protein